MKKGRLLELISLGEGLNIEFKQSRNKLNKDVFDSVCAFLNRNGGHLFLGLDADGNVVRIDIDSIDKIQMNFVTSMNNPIKMSPTFYLTVEEIEIGDKVILYIFVPERSQVHRCNGKIYDRNEDGDLDITDNTNLVARLYMRKQSTYTENKIFPFVDMNDLEIENFVKVRKLASNQKANHPWNSMENLELGEL